MFVLGIVISVYGLYIFNFIVFTWGFIFFLFSVIINIIEDIYDKLGEIKKHCRCDEGNG
jgi:hypothetical protein